MPDISMCNNEECVQKLNCYRYRAVPNEYSQSYILLTGAKEKKDCDHFWEIDNSLRLAPVELIGRVK